MKLKNLILGALMIVSFASFSQDEETERECKRMRFLAGEAIKVKNFQEASMFYLKGETICGGYDAANYARLIGSLRKAGKAETDNARKKAYTDTLISVYNRTDSTGLYDKSNDLFRAYSILQSSTPNATQADELFVRGIKAKGAKTNQTYIHYYYYNLYTIWSGSSEADKPALKSRMISEYFRLSKFVSEGNMSIKTQESLSGYFNNVVKSCDDILPELGGFISTLPQEAEMKKATIMNFLTLLENKECTNSPEYIQLIDTLISIDPNSLDAQLMKAKAQGAKGSHSGAISTLKKAKELATDEAKKNEISYMIASEQFQSHSYKAAYSTALSIKGELKGKALIIAGKSVGQNANNCGEGTFERNCNYIYAVQLLEQAAANGASAGSTISKYKKMYPTSQDCFNNGNPSSVTLTCYGVTVKPCN